MPTNKQSHTARILVSILFFTVTALSIWSQSMAQTPPNETTDHAQSPASARLSNQSRHLALRLKPGQDLKLALQQTLKQHKIKAAAVVTCVGSLTDLSLRFANQPKATLQKGHFEIVSLVGTFDARGCHLHPSASDNTGKTIGGHLMNGCKVYTTAEIVLLSLDDIEFTREKDPTFGYYELVVKAKPKH